MQSSKSVKMFNINENKISMGQLNASPSHNLRHDEMMTHLDVSSTLTSR